eukprot:3366779-Pleurochrysis_carterae.AAC.5
MADAIHFKVQHGAFRVGVLCWAHGLAKRPAKAFKQPACQAQWLLACIAWISLTLMPHVRHIVARTSVQLRWENEAIAGVRAMFPLSSTFLRPLEACSALLH